jgi:dCMP deaminase
MNPPRISWEEYALRIAEVAALRSEDVYRRVGACALNHSNRVIAVAYNGLAPSKTVELDFWANRDKRRQFMIHAEINALSLIQNGECKILACTLMPCPACATAIAANGVKKVVYRDEYERTQKESLEIFDFYGIECQRIIT